MHQNLKRACRAIESARYTYGFAALSLPSSSSSLFCAVSGKMSVYNRRQNSTRHETVPLSPQSKLETKKDVFAWSTEVNLHLVWGRVVIKGTTYLMSITDKILLRKTGGGGVQAETTICFVVWFVLLDSFDHFPNSW